MNPLFHELSAVIKVKLTLSISLFRMQLQAGQSDVKSEFLFRTCSVATNLVTWFKIPFQFAVLLCRAVLASYGTILIHSFQSFGSTATRSATSEHGTVLEQLVRMRNQRQVGTRNGLRTSLVPVQIVCKWNAVSFHVVLNMKSWILLKLFWWI